MEFGKRSTDLLPTLNEIRQIEEWTGMKIGNVIFDSDIDNWKEVTSTFDQKIINKSNLLFLIEEEDGNLFGGYVHEKVNNIDEWVFDYKSFLFSLKSNGRLNKMMKFGADRSIESFYLCDKQRGGLFAVGGEVGIFKENDKNQSYCCQTTFNYNGIENALCGKQYFTPTRITAAQLIQF